MATVVFADLVGSTSLFERLGDEAASRFVTQLVSMLSEIFGQHQGRVVKVLGDGLFVVFQHEGAALAACMQVQNHLLEKQIRPGDSGAPVELQIGIDSGEVVEIEGDCFGDTVNSAARLADLAGASQILTTDNVWKAIFPVQRAALRSMGPMYLRGKTESSHVYRVEWQAGRDGEATMIGRSTIPPRREESLELSHGDKRLQLKAKGDRMSLGRAADAALHVNDPRVSRLHATLEWRGGQFVLTDASSFGTWVYLGNQDEAVVLRRTECTLVGSGQIVLGCAREDEDAPLITFSIKSQVT
ncbi:MAG: adenylate/guanylate cyclase domain-containing protein [Burkholderiales bacterium]|nr:adenylate/guanylate cyclase domain-containing protein [Burkholderiales bacterium]MCZ8294211.1 adenylate/guanylate cyclase domain-containing protein [Hylemonella sp.]